PEPARAGTLAWLVVEQQQPLREPLAAPKLSPGTREAGGLVDMAVRGHDIGKAVPIHIHEKRAEGGEWQARRQQPRRLRGVREMRPRRAGRRLGPEETQPFGGIVADQQRLAAAAVDL